MAYVDSTLNEFDGQLSYQDILHMTYKEIGYLRKHRTMIRKAREKNPSMKDLLKAT